MSHDLLLLRLDGPLMSFGGTTVDQHNVTEPAPTLSMLVGLLGNALGYDHSDFDRLQRLQGRVRFAVRRDRRGEALVDYQTVDLSQEFLEETWTSRGVPATRAGGAEARTGTHIRYRHYWAGAAFTVALHLEPAAEEPTVVTVETALRQPARPLFLGRKTCLPAVPLLLGRVNASSLREAIVQAPLARPSDEGDDGFAAWWPHEEGASRPVQARLRPVVDERDWANQVHVGRRLLWEGRIERAEIARG